MYYIETDGKTVIEGELFEGEKLRIPDGRTIVLSDPEPGLRAFGEHPEKNQFMRKEEDGTYSFLEPENAENERIFYRPGSVNLTPKVRINRVIRECGMTPIMLDMFSAEFINKSGMNEKYAEYLEAIARGDEGVIGDPVGR